MADNTKTQYSHLQLILANHAEAISDGNVQKQTMSSIIDWIKEYNIDSSNIKESDVCDFILELQDKISQLSYKDPDGKTIIPYMGVENGVGAWQYSSAISNGKENLTYISDIEIGRTLNDLWATVENKFGKDITERIFNLDYSRRCLESG